MKDAKQPHKRNSIFNSDPVEGKEGRLEQVESMRRRLEYLVELSFRNDLVIKKANHDQRNNYLRVFGLLKTIRDLQEQYAMELATGKKKLNEPKRKFIS